MSGITQWICHNDNVPLVTGPGRGFPKNVLDCNSAEGFVSLHDLFTHFFQNLYFTTMLILSYENDRTAVSSSQNAGTAKLSIRAIRLRT